MEYGRIVASWKPWSLPTPSGYRRYFMYVHYIFCRLVAFSDVRTRTCSKWVKENITKTRRYYLKLIFITLTILCQNVNSCNSYTYKTNMEGDTLTSVLLFLSNSLSNLKKKKPNTMTGSADLTATWHLILVHPSKRINVMTWGFCDSSCCSSWFWLSAITYWPDWPRSLLDRSLLSVGSILIQDKHLSDEHRSFYKFLFNFQC